jgi:hypothetical protein
MSFSFKLFAIRMLGFILTPDGHSQVSSCCQHGVCNPTEQVTPEQLIFSVPPSYGQ